MKNFKKVLLVALGVILGMGFTVMAATSVIPTFGGGTGQSTYTDGQLLIGNTSTGGLAKSTLTGGTGISISNGSGAITITASGGSVSSGTIGQVAYYPANASAVSGTSTLVISPKSFVGIATTSPMSPFSVTGNEDHWGNYYHFGTSTANDTLYCNSSVQCMVMAGNDNTNQGVNIEVQNSNSGANAYSYVGLVNNLADATGLHYAGMSLNSSGYNSNSFGTGLNIANSFQLLNTDGPIIESVSTSTTVGYWSVQTGGSAVANERVRITSAGLFGVGTTTPTATLTIGGASGTHPFLISTTTASAASTTLFQIKSTGDIVTGGGTPTTSCAGTCVLDNHSNDVSGTINLTGVQTSVTLTFSTAKGWKPHCVTSDNSTANAYEPSTITTTAITLTTAVSIGTGFITYFCPQ